ISATALDAQRLVDELAWFSPELRVCLLPDWETLPYDQFSPHQDLVSERLATLYRIQRGEFDVAVVPAPTALVRLCPPAYIAAHALRGEGHPAAAGARVSARRGGPRALPQPLARAVRRRSVEEIPVPGRFQRRAGRRHRVLPAAVLRSGRDAVRLSSAGLQRR